MSNDRPTLKPEKIEITPEMIEAGRVAFDAAYLGGGEYVITDQIIAQAFLAMLAAVPVRGP